MSSFVFDLSGGHLALDFVNTLSATSGEHLNVYADVVEFAYQSELITHAEADRLQRAAQTSHSASVVTRARELRAALRQIFDALAVGQTPPSPALDTLNAHLALSLGHARVLPADDGFVWGWSGRDLDSVLWPISRAAADLLTSADERALVRECGADDCRWLFLDTTKNRSRQWCSMQACGNREKARRHYRRVKAARGRAPAQSSV
jgi:predicted RNA-binding Zn ribbon-like protein